MKLIKDLMIVVCWTLFLFVLLESGLRLSGAKYEGSFYQPDPVTFASFRPNAAGWILEGENFSRINSLGMHDIERVKAKNQDTLRVALLGDSMVAAQQVAIEKTMGQVLEKILSSAAVPGGHRIEVLNFGVGGYSLAQIYLTEREKVWAFNPDIVIVFLSPITVSSTSRRLYSVGSSSPFFVYQDGRLIQDPRDHPPIVDQESLQERGKLKDLYNRVYLFQLAFEVIQVRIPEKLAMLRSRWTGVVSPNAEKSVNSLTAFSYRPGRTPEEKEAWLVAMGIFKLMNANALAHGAEFWLFDFGDAIRCDPDPVEREKFIRRIDGNSLDYSDRRLQEFAKQEDMRYFAMAPSLLDYATNHNVLLHGFFNTQRNYGHFNEIGNAAAANVVARALLRSSERLATIIRDSSQN